MVSLMPIISSTTFIAVKVASPLLVMVIVQCSFSPTSGLPFPLASSCTAILLAVRATLRIWKSPFATFKLQFLLVISAVITPGQAPASFSVLLVLVQLKPKSSPSTKPVTVPLNAGSSLPNILLELSTVTVTSFGLMVTITVSSRSSQLGLVTFTFTSQSPALVNSGLSVVQVLPPSVLQYTSSSTAKPSSSINSG